MFFSCTCNVPAYVTQPAMNRAFWQVCLSIHFPIFTPPLMSSELATPSKKRCNRIEECGSDTKRRRVDNADIVVEEDDETQADNTDIVAEVREVKRQRVDSADNVEADSVKRQRVDSADTANNVAASAFYPGEDTSDKRKRGCMLRREEAKRRLSITKAKQQQREREQLRQKLIYSHGFDINMRIKPGARALIRPEESVKRVNLRFCIRKHVTSVARGLLSMHPLKAEDNEFILGCTKIMYTQECPSDNVLLLNIKLERAKFKFLEKQNISSSSFDYLPACCMWEKATKEFFGGHVDK